MPTAFQNFEIVNLSAVGQTKQIATTIVTLATNAGTAAPGSYTYLSEAPNIASVNSTGLVTGVGAGTAWITVFNNAGGGNTNNPPNQASAYIAPEPIGYVKITVQQAVPGITVLPN